MNIPDMIFKQIFLISKKVFKLKQNDQNYLTKNEITPIIDNIINA